MNIGDLLPELEGDSTIGPLSLRETLDCRWGVIVSFPLPSHPVATTEIGMICKLLPEFEARNAVVVGVCPSTVEEIDIWTVDIEETQGCSVTLPVVADAAGLWSQKLDWRSGALPSSHCCVIGMDNRMKWTSTSPAHIGRNFCEVLRCLDSVQLNYHTKAETPAHWVMTEKDLATLTTAVK